ncbi:MAG TPA: YHS domain-containing protein [Pirellulales bacterium]|nr:YHS domain-containing protein [Pirellulales bacterium]
MSNTQTLAEQIESRLADAQRRLAEGRRRDEEQCRRMRARQARYDEVAEKLVRDVIQPRMEKLASYFDNATVDGSQPASATRCICRFQHSARFPATVSFAIGCAHDDAVENAIVNYDLEILPVFLKFQPHDQLICALDDIQADRVASWVDEKIVAFVETYLRIEFIDQYQQHTRVTDPVCRTRFNVEAATPRGEYEGRVYYFLSKENLGQFQEAPQKYVRR